MEEKSHEEPMFLRFEGPKFPYRFHYLKRALA